MLMYLYVHCAFSALFALSRARMSEFQQPVKRIAGAVRRRDLWASHPAGFFDHAMGGEIAVVAAGLVQRGP